MIQESVKAATRAERERVQNEANRAEGPNVAPVARECTFAQFMKCSPITFRGNEGAVGGHCGNKSRDQENKDKLIIRRGSGRTSKEAVVVVVEIIIVTGTTTTTTAIRQGNARAMTNVGNQNTNDAGQNVKCNRCGMQHYGNCPIKCNKCGKIGYKARDCWSKVVATDANAQPVVTCYGCGEKGHIKTNCPARNN
nr:hypothetical protein [Tanacetum cinerariifolium]